MAENDPQATPAAAANPALVEAANEALKLQEPIEVKKLATIPTPAEATAEVVESTDEENIFVAASTLEEMNAAQKNLIIWAGKKIEKLKDELKAAEVNLELAKKRKWATEPFKRIVALATKKGQYYEKIRAALEAGYTIIPDMPMDIFAIRTTKKSPSKNYATTSTQYGGGASPNDQVSNSPALGTGKFVSPQAFIQTRAYEKKDDKGNITPMEKAWATEFDEAIDFPFKMAKPSVLNATAKALGQKFFDEIGGAPSRQQARKGDPMVIGRIFYGGKNPWQQKGISFLVTWFIDSKDL
jgi:hypothetical protein